MKRTIVNGEYLTSYYGDFVDVEIYKILEEENGTYYLTLLEQNRGAQYTLESTNLDEINAYEERFMNKLNKLIEIEKNEEI